MLEFITISAKWTCIIWNRERQFSLDSIFSFWSSLISKYLEWIKFSASLLLSSRVLLLNWFTRMVNFGECFNTERERELLLLSKLQFIVWLVLLNSESKCLLFKRLKGNMELEQEIPRIIISLQIIIQSNLYKATTHGTVVVL